MPDIDIKELREKLKLTQVELAEKLGVHPNTILNWENKHHKPYKVFLPRLEELAKEVGMIPKKNVGYTEKQLTDKKQNKKVKK